MNTTLIKSEERNITKLGSLTKIDLNNITPQQKEKLEKIGSSLQVNDINSITNYGCELQTVMSNNADSMISHVKSSNVDEVGELVTGLLAELNMIDIDALAGKGNSIIRFFQNIPIIGYLFKKANNQMIKYDSVKENLKDIEEKIFTTRTIAMRDNTSLQAMFENNINYINQIEQLIAAAKIRLQDIQEEIKNLVIDTSTEIYQKNMYDEFANHLAKKIDDLGRVQYVLKQNLLQIQAVQSNNISIAEKANDIITTTIPLWKSQISLAVALSDQKKSIEAQRKISDTTNELLRKEAEMLKENSIAVAHENERSIIDIDTLKETQRLLIDTVMEVRKIHEEGASARLHAQQELIQLANEFRDNISMMLPDSDQPKQLKEVDNINYAEFEDIPENNTI